MGSLVCEHPAHADHLYVVKCMGIVRITPESKWHTALSHTWCLSFAGVVLRIFRAA